ncbi:MAG: ATP-binding cassette domain-containing protein [Pseudomonadota bacterium]|nr:ATP-binding cassette domain-containing protein [Pseudomonadota bacterium]
MSIGAVIPFLGVLIDPQQIFENDIAEPFIEILSINQASELILPLTIVFMIAAVISGSLRILLLWAQNRVAHAIGADISYGIYRSTLYRSYADHASRNSSEVIAGITAKADGVALGIVLPFLTLLSSALLIIAILVTLISIAPIVTISAFVCFGSIYGLIILVTRRQLQLNGELISSLITKRIKVLNEGLGGIRDVILSGTQSTYTQVYRDVDLPLRYATASNQVISGSPRVGIEALGMVLIAGLACTLVSEGDGISNVIPVLGALAIGAQRMLPVLQQVYSSLAAIKSSEAVLEDALEFLEQPLPSYVNKKQTEPMTFENSITTKNLSFRYAREAPWVLQNLNLQIKKGTKVGFIGITGSGKSTLLDILMGLLEPNDGQLFIDNTAIDDENRRAWRANIVHVPQSIFLADATIAENIAFGIPVEEIDRHRVREAAKMAQIADTIEGWEGQYEVIVGERGIRLSGGQRQRIAIARAFYKQANVIFFDEATSALDNDTERAVTDAIANIGTETTVLIIAHRLTSLAGCNLVIELENGKVKRQGSYKEMVGQKLN